MKKLPYNPAQEGIDGLRQENRKFKTIEETEKLIKSLEDEIRAFSVDIEKEEDQGQMAVQVRKERKSRQDILVRLEKFLKGLKS